MQHDLGFVLFFWMSKKYTDFSDEKEVRYWLLLNRDRGFTEMGTFSGVMEMFYIVLWLVEDLNIQFSKFIELNT